MPDDKMARRPFPQDEQRHERNVSAVVVAEERQSALAVPALAVAEEGQAEERRRWSAKLPANARPNPLCRTE